eukprot:scaffold7530_cov74-Phaeocystis_antarctica.AAC.6
MSPRVSEEIQFKVRNRKVHQAASLKPKVRNIACQRERFTSIVDRSRVPSLPNAYGAHTFEVRGRVYDISSTTFSAAADRQRL